MQHNNTGQQSTAVHAECNVQNNRMHFLSGIRLSVDAADSGHAYAMQTHAVTQTQLLTGVWLAVDFGEHCELHDG